MKGIVFTELMEMVEERFSPEAADAIVRNADLPSGGAYTAVGSYPVGELRSLLAALSERVGLPVERLYVDFGRHLLHRLAERYPVFFATAGTAHGLLRRLDDTIHVEVHKLYPEAELPRFFVEEDSGGLLVVRYESPRAMWHLARGLIEGCGEYFREALSIDEQLLADDGTVVRFRVEAMA